MFFDIFKSLCEENEISCKRAVADIGLSNSISTKWKKTGATPKGDTLKLIAEYFNVSTDYLLGETDDPINYDDPDFIASLNPNVLSTFNGNAKKAYEFEQAQNADVRLEMEQQAKDDIAKVALFGGDGEVTEEMWQEVKDYVAYIKQKHFNRGGE